MKIDLYFAYTSMITDTVKVEDIEREISNHNDDFKVHLLIESLLTRQIEITNIVLKYPINDNIKYALFWTVLDLKYFDVAEVLLNNGIDVNRHRFELNNDIEPDGESRIINMDNIDEQFEMNEFLGVNPLYDALCFDGTDETIEFLIKHDADITDMPEGFILHQAIREDYNIDSFKLIVETCMNYYEGFNIDYVNHDGFTPLHLAASLDDRSDIVEFLIFIGAYVFPIENTSQATILISAAKNDNFNEHKFSILLNAIITSDAEQYDINEYLNYADSFGNVVLTYLITNRNERVIEEFLKIPNIDVNIPNKEHKTPLHYAAEYGTEREIDLIIRHYAKHDIKDINGFYPIHYAAKSDNLGAFKALMYWFDCLSLMTDDEQHLNSTFIAAHYGSINVLNFILNNYDSNINQINYPGRTLLIEAIIGLSPNILFINYLLEQGIEINVLDYYGKSALYYAVSSMKHGIAKLLLESGAFLNYYDVSGKQIDSDTPLHAAVKNNDIKMLELIFSYDVDVNAINSTEFQTPLIVACQSKSIEAALFLLNSTSDLFINHQDIYGMTALHYATMIRNGEQLVEAILKYESCNERCVNVCLMNDEGFTACDYAREYMSINLNALIYHYGIKHSNNSEE